MKRNFAQICTSDEFKASHRWWRLKKMKLLQYFKKMKLQKNESVPLRMTLLRLLKHCDLIMKNEKENLMGGYNLAIVVSLVVSTTFKILFQFCVACICIFAAPICICICIFAAWPNPLKIASQQWQPRGPGERDPTSKQCGQVRFLSTL